MVRSYRSRRREPASSERGTIASGASAVKAAQCFTFGREWLCFDLPRIGKNYFAFASRGIGSVFRGAIGGCRLAAAKAEAAGLKVVMNRCPKIEYGRLSSEISWMGVNSRTLSSKRAPMPTQGMRLSLNRTSLGGGETAASDRAAKDKTDLA